MLKKAAQRFFSPQRMVAEEQICGEIPSTKAVYKRAFDVSWPATVESVLVGLVGIVDTIMVGTLGSAAIAAVGLGQVRIGGMISQIDNINRILDRVALYLA